MRNRNRKSKAGFTLIELLLVVVIIGILAAIVVPKLTGRTQDAQIGATKGQIKSFQTALSTYEIDNGKYPEQLSWLIEKPNVTPELTKWKKYLDSSTLPPDPWGHDYYYKFPGDKNPDSYDLRSMGPDGSDGTDDDIEKP